MEPTQPLNPSTTEPSPEEAFRRASDGYTFLDRKLEPFSFLRQTALLTMSIEIGGSFAGEVAASIWLMSLPDERVRAIRQNPSQFVEELDRFADDNQLGAVAGRNYQQARDLFDQIRKDIEACTGKPKGDSQSDDEEPGN